MQNSCETLFKDSAHNNLTLLRTFTMIEMHLTLLYLILLYLILFIE